MTQPISNNFTLEPGESVSHVIRQHKIVLIEVWLTVLALAAVALVFYVVGAIASYFTTLPSELIYLMAMIVAGLAVLILIVGSYIYSHNIMILTNLHLVEIKQQGLFNRTVSRLSLDEVVDVAGFRPGVLQTILNYGDIEVETPASRENFVFKNVGNPEGTANLILQAHDARSHEIRGNNKAGDKS